MKFFLGRLDPNLKKLKLSLAATKQLIGSNIKVIVTDKERYETEKIPMKIHNRKSCLTDRNKI